MAHGADGIADFVSDAGGQPPERGELALLHAFGHETGVLEENQRGPGRDPAQRREVRLNHPGAVGSDETRWGVIAALALPPGRQRVQQTGRYFADQCRGYGMLFAEDFRRRFIDEPDPVGGVDHQQAFAQVLHDILRELGKIREVEIFLAYQIFALAHAARDEACRGRDGE